MITLYWYVLLDLNIVNAFEYRKSVSNTRHADLLQIVMLQRYKCFADNFVFYFILGLSAVLTWFREHT